MHSWRNNSYGSYHFFLWFSFGYCYESNFIHNFMCMGIFPVCTSLCPLMPSVQRSQQMVIEHQAVELLSFFMNQEWEPVYSEESSVLLTTQIFSHQSFLFFIIFFPMQPNHGQMPEAYLKDLNSPPGERITLGRGEVP